MKKTEFLSKILTADKSEFLEIIKSRIDLLHKTENENFEFPFGKRTTSFAGFVTENDIIPVSDYPEYFLRFNDIEKVYEKLMAKIQESKDSLLDFDKFLTKVLSQTIYETIGENNTGTDFDRTSKYTLSKHNTCDITDFYGRDCSQCAERAVMAHNLFKFLGYESYLMAGPILINNQKIMHFYNAIYSENKGYLFDFACSKYEKNSSQKNPLIKQFDENELIALESQRKNSLTKLDLNNSFKPIIFKNPKGKTYIIEYGKYKELSREL